MNFEKSVCRFMIIMGLLEVEQKVRARNKGSKSLFKNELFSRCDFPEYLKRV